MPNFDFLRQFISLYINEPLYALFSQKMLEYQETFIKSY